MPFDFKQFSIDDSECAMKVGTDSVLLGAWTDVTHASRVIDLGAGSGLLTLMIAQRAPEANISAIESDPSAASSADYNFNKSKWAKRLDVSCIDAFAHIPEEKADLIICNPPYFVNGLMSPDVRRAKARHTCGELGPVKAVELAAIWLKEGGSLAMVTPIEYDDDVTYASEMLHMHIWRKCIVTTVEGKPPSRLLWQIALRHDCRYEETRLTVRRSSGYTEQYRCLTNEFYLDF